MRNPQNSEGPDSPMVRAATQAAAIVALLPLLLTCGQPGEEAPQRGAESPSDDPSDAAPTERAAVVTPDGRPAALEPAADAVAQVLLFLATECPVANRYAPEVKRLAAEFEPDGVEFVLVYADAVDTPERVRAHRTEYAYTIPAVLDHGQRLVERTGATMTPEAAVYDDEARLVYRGRIDDRQVEYGVERHEPRARDLHRVLTALAAGERLELETTKAVGCFIPPLE